VWCNGGANLTVSATPLTTNTAAGDPDSFTNRFDLTVSGGAMTAYLNGQSIDTSQASGDTVTFDRPVAFETGLGQYSEVNISVLPSLRSGEPRRAVAGHYTATVTFTASPHS
jgi:hypothetical protein